MMVIRKVSRAVRAADRMRREHAELLLHRQNKNLETVEKERIGGPDDAGDVLIDERAENQRPRAVLFALAVDLLDGGMRFVDRVDERKRDFIERYHLELCQQTVAEHLGRDSGAV